MHAVLKLIRSSGLTGTSPAPRTVDPTTTTTAGLTHALDLDTKYYRTSLPIWLDETASASAWKEDFLTPEAAEVIRAVGAWVVVFRLGGTVEEQTHVRDLIAAVGEVIDKAFAEEGGQDAWDGALLAVSMGRSGTVQSAKPEESIVTAQDEDEQWDDACLEHGFEYVNGTATGGSALDKKGVERVREALEANDWSNQAAAAGSDEDEIPSDDGNLDAAAGMKVERAELGAEFARLKLDLQGQTTQDGEDEEVKVEELERMMKHLQAARGQFLRLSFSIHSD